jgi:hypothetical protein
MPLRNWYEVIMAENAVNYRIDSPILRSDFMISRIAEARRFWSDKAREERKKKKLRILVNGI